MRPLSGKTAVAHVEAVVRRVNDDSVLRESRLLQCLQYTVHYMIDAGQHPEIGPHVLLVFFGVSHRQ